jgi:hypothetical protein
VVEWSRALDVRLSEWCCSVSMVWVQIPSREEQKFDSSKIRVEQSKSIESHRSKNLFDFQPVLCGVNLISSPFGIILLAIYARKLDT